MAAGVAALPIVGGRRRPLIWEELAISGASVGGATMCTNPLDVVKTRLQLNSSTVVSALQRPGLVNTAISIVREEGVIALWSGLPPAVFRGFLYGGLRLGLYKPCKELLASAAAGPHPPSASAATPTATSTNSNINTKSNSSSSGSADPGVGLKLAAGTLSGALAAGLTSPTELVKTRMQTAGAARAGAAAVAAEVVRQHGVLGLWRGAVPSTARAALLTACQVATYDEVKRPIMAATGWGDCTATHLAASGLTGLVTTTVTNPVDVIKTRMFAAGVGGQARRGVAGTAVELLREAGLAGFQKGWTANFARLGPQTVLTFMFSEALRTSFGLQSL